MNNLIRTYALMPTDAKILVTATHPKGTHYREELARAHELVAALHRSLPRSNGSVPYVDHDGHVVIELIHEPTTDAGKEEVAQIEYILDAVGCTKA